MEKDDVAKRRAYRRKKARKKHLLVGFVIFLIIGIIVFAALSLTVLFPVKKATFSGSKVYTSAQVETNIDIIGQNIITLSEKTIADTARRKLPYIDSVKIKRSFPDTVSVEITDAVEYAAYEQNGKYVITSVDGYILNIKASKPQSLIMIKAKIKKSEIGGKIEFEDEKTSATIETIVSELKKYKIKTDTIDITVPTEIKVGIMNNRFSVNLGTKQDIDKKLKHLSVMIKEIDGSSKGKIDLSGWNESNPTGILSKE